MCDQGLISTPRLNPAAKLSPVNLFFPSVAGLGPPGASVFGNALESLASAYSILTPPPNDSQSVMRYATTGDMFTVVRRVSIEL